MFPPSIFKEQLPRTWVSAAAEENLDFHSHPAVTSQKRFGKLKKRKAQGANTRDAPGTALQALQTPRGAKGS